MKKGILIFIVVFLIVIAIFIFPNKLNENTVSATVYKSVSCGCCDVHANYLSSKGDFNVDLNQMTDTTSIKSQYNIPSDLQSCHTTIIGDYFIEGHIPLKAIDKLLLEQPDIAGIAMPGMPAGSPGMPGIKTNDFVIYGVENNGSYYEFMRI